MSSTPESSPQPPPESAANAGASGSGSGGGGGIFSSNSNAAPEALRQTPPPAIPMLGMLVDRTSFDETDDFGFDGASKLDGYVAGPAVVMKDGRVRRRLRWRPKGMAKRRRPTHMSAALQKANRQQQQQQQSGSGFNSGGGILKKSSNNSSNSSVVSSSSKQSKKSLHSFASTETAAINNTAKAKSSNKFPLPRPTPKPMMNGGATTIGNEGDFVQARISSASTTLPSGSNNGSSATLFAAADTVEVVHPQTPPSGQSSSPNRSGSRGSSPNNNNNKPPRGSSNSGNSKSSKSPSRRPPLFRPNSGRSSKAAIAKSPSRDEDKRNKKSSPSRSSNNNNGGSSSSSGSSPIRTSSGQQQQVPVPVLSGEEVEIDRRVDLRIRRTPSTMSHNTTQHKTSTLLEKGVAPLSVNELRSPSSSLEVQAAVDDEDDDDGEEEDPRQDPATDGADEEDALVTKGSNFSPGRMLKQFKKRTRGSGGAQQQTSSSFSEGELRFSMSGQSVSAVVPPIVDATSSLSAASSDSAAVLHKAHTGPVDLDDGTFLEAEKNLQAIHEMASEHLRQGEFAEALEVFEEILRGQLTRYGEEHYRVGTALHNIGIVHMRRGDYARAVTVYKEAVRVRKLSLDPDHPDVAVSLAQLGVAYMESNRHRKAIGAFREALKIRRKCLGNDHPKVAKILNNIGCSLFELDELDVAKVAFEEALEIQRNLLRTLPPTSEEGLSENSLLSIASTQSNIASIKLFCGQYDEACVGLEEALLIQQCVLGDDHPLARRTQESLKWMENSRDGNHASSSRGSGALRGLLLMSGNNPAISVFDSLEEKLNRMYAGFDVACTGWENQGKDESGVDGADHTVVMTTSEETQ